MKNKRNNTLYKTFGFIVAAIGLWATAAVPMEVRAESAMPSSGNVQFDYPNRRPVMGGDWYWHSSRAREWLHSTSMNPQYTNKGSVQEKTRGFLSGFTDHELDQIAVTRRKAFVNTSYHGTNRNGPPQSGSHIHQGNDSLGRMKPQFMHYFSNPLHHYGNVRHVVAHDKVFLLNPAEFQQYVQLRGVDIVRTTDSAGYWISGTQVYTGNVSRGQAVNNQGIHIQTGNPGTTSRGMVPALHLHPDSETAKGLKIGDIVEFGRYTSDNGIHNGPIKWEVINLTDGYPLLWAIKSVEKTPYNVHPQSKEENAAYAYSDYVRFEDYDIDITEDLKYTNPNGTHSEAPRMWLDNKEDHQNRRTGNWVAIMRAESPVGIEWMESPDGTRVYDDEVRYTITENDMGGKYVFRTKDNHGNHHGTHLPVGNIDEEVEVDILFDLPSTGWANKPVTTTIQLSNQAVHGSGYSTRTAAGWTPFYPPAFTTYLNTRYHVEGQVRLVEPNDIERVKNSQYDSSTFTANLSSPSWLNGEYMPVMSYDRELVFKMSDLMEAGTGNWMDWEYTRQITGNFLQFSGGIGVHRAYNPSTLGIEPPVLEFRNVNFTLLDTDNFELEHIVLPDGTKILNPPNVFTDTLHEAGDYSYEVKDSRGYVWKESVDMKIDRTSPSLEITDVK